MRVPTREIRDGERPDLSLGSFKAASWWETNSPFLLTGYVAQGETENVRQGTVHEVVLVACGTPPPCALVRYREAIRRRSIFQPSSFVLQRTRFTLTKKLKREREREREREA